MDGESRQEGAVMSLDRLRDWCAGQRRADLMEGRTARELSVLEQVADLAFSLDEVSPALPAASSLKTASYDVGFTLPIEGKKRPVHFCDIAFQRTYARWARKPGRIPPETVRVYLQLNKKRCDASALKDRFQIDDTGRWREEWHYLEVSPEFDVSSPAFSAAIEDAYDTLRYKI